MYFHMQNTTKLHSINLKMNLLPFFSSSAHVLLNSVSKLGLFRAFDDPVRLCVDVEAVIESFKMKRHFFH